MKRYIFSAIAALAAILPVCAQENTNKEETKQVSRTQALINASLKNWEIELRAGYQLGGISPIPLPKEIRSLDSYKPTVPLTFEANATKRFGYKNKWGVMFGIKFENKNMDTKATTKNYSMEIIGDDGAKVAGRWTGGVQTSVRNSYLTFPVTGVYRVHPRTNIKLGMFFSYLLDGKFDGYVYDGYLRQDDPTGLKAEFEGDNVATYDFSDHLRQFQYGIQAGVDWTAFKHLKVYADLTWGLNDAFHSGFKTITFDIYPIYYNIGAGYIF